ncbi:MAG TPA: DUF6249 domain-containing protein [Oligoflexus sp.]|uniref:DUF6249 domain-containing protein n=1 Tax=Oligoflexus sp. TaxID=1971216 RepID=UPI002D49242F|nr:DUF6249 domain-containing protein [Oligoflexus sp.]HYX38191.1 DUF6249 domain-containing protein [Oligoflexus sp.]
MKRISRSLILTLMTSVLSWNIAWLPASAAEVEERKGVMTEPPAPTPPTTAGQSGDVVMLGTLALPNEVIKKLDAQQLAEIVEAQAEAQRNRHRAGFGEEVVAPALFFISLTIISFLLIYFSFRKRREVLDTVRVAIQSGQTLPASFLEALESKPKPSPDSDLRKAILLLALGLSAIGVFLSIPDADANQLWTIGLLPTLLGLGYLFLWRLSQKRQRAGSSDDAR